MPRLRVEQLVAELGPGLVPRATVSRSGVSAAERRRIARRVAFAAVREEVSAWDSVVDRQREATQLDFTTVQLPMTTPRALVFPRAESREGVLGELAGQLASRQLLNPPTLTQADEAGLKARHRALLLYHELRAKRVKRIKSKLYRRRRRKAQTGDGVDDAEVAEHRRVEERATLRHRAKGKFVGLLRRYTGDRAAAELQKDLHVRRSEIVEKAREAEEELVADSEAESANLENALEDDGLTPTDAPDAATGIAMRVMADYTRRLAAEPLADDGNPVKQQPVPLGVSVAGLRRGLPVDLPAAPTLFGSDDLVEEFQAEKEAEVAAAVPQERAAVGWGEWAGPGVVDHTHSRQKALDEQRQTRIDAYRRTRDDFNNSRVIAGPAACPGRLLSKGLPFGVASKEEFDRVIATPLGREWAGARLSQQLVKPAVVVQPGVVIPPLDRRRLPKLNHF